MQNKETLWFVYDGECPICQMGASLYRVRQSVGELKTVDARTEKNHSVMQEVNAAQLNLDNGMVVKYQNRLYQGKDALNLMAKLGGDDSVYNKINSRLFKSAAVSAACYPFMRGARNIALALKGVGKLNNLDDVRGSHE
ncbi:MAG: DCC1-like thiol-disulfide oxidoreductase family protein [Alphaproteobacteria bacterium]